MREYVEAGGNPNDGAEDGFTPLMAAAEAADVAIVAYLTSLDACDMCVAWTRRRALCTTHGTRPTAAALW